MQGFTNRANHPLNGKTLGICFRILIVALFVFNDSRLIAAVHEKDSISFFYLVPAYSIAFLSIGLLLLSKNTLIRTITEVLLFSSVYTDILYIILGNFPFSYPDAINLFNNPEYASSAIVTFGTAFLLAFAGAGIVFALVRASVNKLTFSYSPSWLFLFIAIQVFLYCYSKQYPGIHDFFPSVYRVTGNLLIANRFSAQEQWRRVRVTEKPGKKNVTHLFLVVDESVTGTVLSINGFPLSTTPFLQANAEKFINFGTATSFTNFSAGSNLSLLSGMLLNELPDKKYVSFCKSNIFQYAKNAGYQTYLLDAQSSGNKLQNYTTSRDLFFIDSLFQPRVNYPSMASYSRDSTIAEKIALIAKMETPTFAYINKAGAHWPYSTDFPTDSLNNYFPLSINRNKNLVTYFKSVLWSVDKFWERLAGKLTYDSSVLILYTSDHGENYASESFKIKHASIYHTTAVEGLVPLLVFDQANFFPEKFVPPVNRYSHQYIFPTLLSAMGYDKNFIRNTYGRTLLEPSYPQPRWFQTGDLFGRGKNTRIFVDKK